MWSSARALSLHRAVTLVMHDGVAARREEERAGMALSKSNFWTERCSQHGGGVGDVDWERKC